jgi:outer membrane protein
MSDKSQGRDGKSWLSCFCLLPFALCLVVPAPAAEAQGLKIGYVNMARIEKESATAARSIETLKQEFEPRREQIQELQKRIATAREQYEREQDQLQPADAQARRREIGDMMRQSDQTVLRFQQELAQRGQELRLVFIQEVRAAIKAVGDAGKFDMILQEAAFAHPAIDVTEQVMKAMAK